MATSKIVTASITDNAVTAAKTSGIPARPNAQALVINGDMAVAQRSTSETGVTTEGYKTCDRFKLNGTVSGAQLTIIQEALTSGEAFNNGFKTAWRADCTTATAPAAGERLELQYKMEAQDCSLFKSGTSNAQKFTLAFWVKSSYTGAAQVNLYNADSSPNRVCGATYTISSADTWEYKVLNFAADTSNGFNNDTGWGLGIYFMLAAGSNYTSGSVPTAWESYSNADFAAGGTPALSSNTANDWAITGVQLEVGEYSSSTLPPFQHESFGDNYRRCLRYCYQITSDSSVDTDIVSMTGTGSAGFGAFRYPVQMRGNPAVSVTADGDFSLYGDTSSGLSSLRGDRINTNSCGLVTDTSVSSGDSASLRLDSDSGNKYLRFDAEL